MACWWVFQNTTYKEESEGSFLWAPKKDKGGKTPYHWKTMLQLEDGDIVFSCVKQKIVAISTVINAAYTFDKPFYDTNLDNTWETEGYKADLLFTELNTPIDLSTIRSTLMPMMPAKHGPLNVKGTGNQGYLYHISDAIGNYLVSLTEKSNDITLEEKEVSDIRHSNNIEDTVKESLIQSRVGQGGFRKDLLAYWENRCAVTTLKLPEILKASHIKPWKFSNNYERLDPNNGLLLSPHYDEAFDKGFISFEDDGSIIFSERLTGENANALGFNSNDKIQKLLTPAQKEYLKYHREERLLN